MKSRIVKYEKMFNEIESSYNELVKAFYSFKEKDQLIKELNNYYGSSLLRAIAEALDEKYQKEPYPDDVPWVDTNYKPMYDVINQSIGFTPLSEVKVKGSKLIRDRYNKIIPLFYDLEPEEEVLPIIEEI